LQPVLGAEQRGEENVQQTTAGFDGQRGAHGAKFVVADHRQLLRHRRERDVGVGAGCGVVQRSADRVGGGERRAGCERVGFGFVLDRFGIDPRQAFERQPQADGGVAGDQEHRVAAEKPFAALPAAGAVVDHPAQRQHAADRGGQAVAEHVRQPRAFQWIFQLGVFHHHVGG